MLEGSKTLISCFRGPYDTEHSAAARLTCAESERAGRKKGAADSENAAPRRSVMRRVGSTAGLSCMRENIHD